MRTVLILLVLAALLWGAISLFDNGPGIEYRTEPVTMGSIADIVTANGTINPVELVTIGAQVSGKVEHLYAKLNDHVKAGQLLADIDPSLLVTQLKQDQSSLETARSSYQQARRDLNRTRMLVEKDYIAKVELERAEQTYLQARNAYDSAKTVLERDRVNLGYAKITSPINGVIISQDVTMGQTLASSFQSPNLFKIAGDLAQMKIDVNLSESDIIRVKRGMPVTFTVAAYPDKEFTGIVDTVNLSPTAQQSVVMYSVSVLAQNPELLLLPGMTAYVTMTVSEKKDVLRVPASALRFKPPPQKKSMLENLFKPGGSSRQIGFDQEGPDHTIYLLKHNVVVPVEVTTGATDNAFIEITGPGVAQGDQVILGMKTVRPQ